MSRVGKKPIIVPSGVEVTINGNVVTVKGPKGTLTKEFNSILTIKEVKGEDHHKDVCEIVIERPNDLPEVRAIHGTTRSLLHNMVVGVSEGFKKTLNLVGVGYRAALKGKGVKYSDEHVRRKEGKKA